VTKKETNFAAWIALWRVSGIGCVRYKKLLDAFKHPEVALDASSAEL